MRKKHCACPQNGKVGVTVGTYGLSSKMEFYFFDIASVVKQMDTVL